MALNAQQKAIAVDLATGETQRAAARRHGIHYMTITLWKRSSDFLAEVERLRSNFRRAAGEQSHD